MTRVLGTTRIGCLLLCLAALCGGSAMAAGNDGRNVLVLGGTGQLGAEIVKRLVANGDHVTVFARPTSDRGRLHDLDVDYAIGDLMNESEIAAALRARKYDTVISALRVEGNDLHFYEKIMGPLTRQAREAGVGHIIHNSAVGAGDNAKNFTHLDWERVPGLLDRLRDQGAGEQLLRAGGVPYTIIRNTRIWPDGTPSTGTAELTEDQQVLTPMTRADVAIFNVQCVGNAACIGKTYHIRDLSLAWPPPRPPT